MKVLYVGHYKEGGGWANAAKGLISALDSVGVDVVCRNIILTQNQPINDNLKKLESKDTTGVDFCIQNVLPHHLIGSTKFKKNIAYHLLESTNLKYNAWITNLRYMDEVWVPCKDNQVELKNVDIENVKTVPLAFDLDSYKRSEKDLLNFKAYGINSSYKFYTIANINQRKNIESIIKCYYATFKPNEDVVLIIKVNKHGYNKNSLFNYMNHICENIRKEMGIYPKHEYYNNIIVIADNLNDKEISSLHNQSDCFINLSHGEAWSIPAFEAMCYGNHPICTSWGGPTEYINKNDKETGYLIDYTWKTCTNSDAAFNHIFRGNEFWTFPNEKQASEAMRYYYENRKSEKNNQGLIYAEQFSLKNVGNKIKEILES